MPESHSIVRMGYLQSHTPESIPGVYTRPLGHKPQSPVTYLAMDQGDGHQRERQPAFPHLRKREEGESKGAGPRSDPRNFFGSRRFIPLLPAPSVPAATRPLHRAHRARVRNSGGHWAGWRQRVRGEGGSVADHQAPRKSDLGSLPLKTPPSPPAGPPAPPHSPPLLQLGPRGSRCAPSSRSPPRSPGAPMHGRHPHPLLDAHPRILRFLKRRHWVSLSQGTLKQRRGKSQKPHVREGRWPAAAGVTEGTSCGLQRQLDAQHSGHPYQGWDSNLSIPEPPFTVERERGGERM